MLKYDFENSITYWVLMTANMLERSFTEQIAPYGITHRQWQVLGWLALEGSLCQTDLAERMQIEPATLVRVLDRMERDHWVTRVPSPTDRRKKMITPTQRAKPIWEKVAECGRRVRERAAKGLTKAQLESLRHMLNSVQANLASNNQKTRNPIAG